MPSTSIGCARGHLCAKRTVRDTDGMTMGKVQGQRKRMQKIPISGQITFRPCIVFVKKQPGRKGCILQEANPQGGILKIYLRGKKGRGE